MPEISEAAIEKRAGELAERDGFEWQTEFRGHRTLYEPIRPKGRLSDDDRQQYLDRARSELSKEAGNA